MADKKPTKKRHTAKGKTAISSDNAPQKNHAKESGSKRRFHHIVKEKLNINHELPLGIRVFLIYLSILSFFYISSSVISRKSYLFGMTFEGAFSVILNLITALLILGLIYGFAKKEIRYYHLSLGFFTLVIINSLLSIYAVRLGTVGTIRELINMLLILMVVLNAITLIFIFSKKYYFLHPKPEYHVHADDKIFIASLIILWGLIIITSMVFIDKYYKESFIQADQIIIDLNGKGVIEASYYCNAHTNPDLCNYIGALMNSDDPNSIRLCEKITLPLFYDDCVRTVGAVSE